MTEVSARVRAMFEESGLPGGDDDLVDLLAGLEPRYVDESAPEPGPELARLLDEGQPPEGRTTRWLSGRRRRIAAAGALALGTVVGTGVAAAANELPPPAQRWVAELSERFLHVDLPRPDTAPAVVVKDRADRRRHAKAEEHDARPHAPVGPQTVVRTTSGPRQGSDGGGRDETTRDESSHAQRADGSGGDDRATHAAESREGAVHDDTATRESAPSTVDQGRLDESRELERAGGENGRDG